MQARYLLGRCSLIGAPTGGLNILLMCHQLLWTPLIFLLSLKAAQRVSCFGVLVLWEQGRRRDSLPFGEWSCMFLNFAQGASQESQLPKGQMLPISDVQGKANIAKQRCTWESVFRSRARGVVPGSTPASYGSVPGRHANFFLVRAAIAATSTNGSDLVRQESFLAM